MSLLCGGAGGRALAALAALARGARKLASGAGSGASSTSKQVMVAGDAGGVRVRRARWSDAARVLRFLRAALERGALAPARPQLALADAAARALAQGHSLLAERARALRGVALAAAACPWDARQLERAAAHVRCARSRRLLRLAALCQAAPALHARYAAPRILQVLLVVPGEGPGTAETVRALVESSIKRGREAGFPLVRFDVTDDIVAKTLEEMNMKKEWQLAYDALPEILRELDESLPPARPPLPAGRLLAVYCARTAPAARRRAPHAPHARVKVI